MHHESGYVPCPHCGEQINKNAKACPYCGSDEQTGWSDQTYMDDIDLGDDIDYEDLVQKEFPKSTPALKKISWITVVGAIVLFFFIATMLKIF
jgi:uncharacterized membrane protein YvbJ